jgi:hypothetical protein
MNETRHLPRPRPPLLPPRTVDASDTAAASQGASLPPEGRRPPLPARPASPLDAHATPEARGYGAG